MPLQTELGMRRGYDSLSLETLLSIYFTASQARKKAAKFLRAYGLTDVQFNVLSLLKRQSGENGGLTQVELSKMLLVNRANITTLVDRMEKADLVARKPVPGDRRYNVIELTGHGEQMFADVEEIYLEKTQEIMSVLDETEMRALMGMLEKVRKNLVRVAGQTVPSGSQKA